MIYMCSFLCSISLFVLCNWSLRQCFSGYQAQTPKLLGPTKILTRWHCLQNSWMESQKCFDSLNYIFCYFETWKFLIVGEIPLANLYISVTWNRKFQEIARNCKFWNMWLNFSNMPAACLKHNFTLECPNLTVQLLF